MGVCAKKACPAKQDRASAALHHPFNIQKYASPVTGRNRRNLPAPAPSEPQLGSDFQGRLLSTGSHPARLALPFPDLYSLRPCLSDCQPVLYNNARSLSRGMKKKGALPVREAGEGQLFSMHPAERTPEAMYAAVPYQGKVIPAGSAGALDALPGSAHAQVAAFGDDGDAACSVAEDRAVLGGEGTEQSCLHGTGGTVMGNGGAEIREKGQCDE